MNSIGEFSPAFVHAQEGVFPAVLIKRVWCRVIQAMDYTFRFFGEFQIFMDGKAEGALRGKTLAMIAYLACHERGQTRQTLAELFCSEAEDRAASLRWHLSRIRKALGKEFIQSDGPRLRIDYNREQSELTRFEEALQNDLGLLETPLLESTLSLYRGEFLKGFQLKQAPNFEIWLSGERSRLAMVYEKGSKVLLQRLIESARHTEAITWAQRLLENDPLREEVHSLLMWLYARDGQRDAAIQQYELCKQLRKTQLDIELMDETEDLYQQVLEGDFSPAHTAFLPTGHLHPNPPDNPAQHHLLSRQAELRQLAAAWQDAHNGEGQCILITAPAGGGKSELLRAFIAKHAIEHPLQGHCYQQEQQLPYTPWLEIFEPLLQTLDATHNVLPSFVAEQIARIAPSWGLQHLQLPPPPLPETPQELHHFYTALSLCLTELHNHPRLLIIEDLQWADEASLRFFHYLARSLKHKPCLLLATFRDDEPEPYHTPNPSLENLRHQHHIAWLELKPFEPQELQDYLRQRFQELPEAQLEALSLALYSQAGGHPLYTMELLQHWDPTTPVEQIPLSSSITDLLQQTLSLFSQKERQLLEIIALFARPAGFLALQLASSQSEEEVMSTIEHALQRQLLLSQQQNTERTYGFRHVLIQRVLSEQISPIRQQLLHKRIALALEQTQGKAPQIAIHWRHAENPERELLYTRQAAELARESHATLEAIACLQRCLTLTQDRLDALPFFRQLTETLQLEGRWEEAEQTLKQLVKEARRLKSTEYLAQSAISMGRLLSNRGDHSKALRWFMQGQKECIAADDLIGASLAWGGAGKAHRQQGAFTQALSCYQQKFTLAQTLQNNHLQCEAQGAMGSIYIQMGDFEKALECFEATLQIAIDEEQLLDQEELHASFGDESQFTISRIMGHAGFFSNQQDKYQEALAYFEQQLTWLDESGESKRLRRGLEHLSTWHAWMGNHQRALLFLQRHFQLATQQFSFPGLSKAASNMGELYRQLGDFPRAQACYTYKLSIALDLKDPNNVASSLNHIASLLSEQHDLQQADTLSQIAIQLCRNNNLFFELADALFIRAWLLSELNHTEQALSLATEALSLSQKIQRHRTELSSQLLLLQLQATQNPSSATHAIQHLTPQLIDATDEELILLHHTLAALYHHQGDNTNATEHDKKSQQLAQKHRNTLPHTLATHHLRAKLSTPDTSQIPDLPPQIKMTPSSLSSHLKRIQKLFKFSTQPT